MVFLEEEIVTSFGLDLVSIIGEVKRRKAKPFLRPVNNAQSRVWKFDFSFLFFFKVSFMSYVLYTIIQGNMYALKTKQNKK